jgi:hypothetical protein
MQHSVEPRISRRKKIDGVSRKEDDSRNRDQRHHVDDQHQQNASRHDRQRDGVHIPVKAGGNASEHHHCAYSTHWDENDQNNYGRQDANNNSRPYSHYNFHAHVAGETADFAPQHGPEAPPSF